MRLLMFAIVHFFELCAPALRVSFCFLVASFALVFLRLSLTNIMARLALFLALLWKDELINWERAKNMKEWATFWRSPKTSKNEDAHVYPYCTSNPWSSGCFFAPFESDVCLCLFPCATTRLIVFFLSV
jgi:hypothetical protein